MTEKDRLINLEKLNIEHRLRHLENYLNVNYTTFIQNAEQLLTKIRADSAIVYQIMNNVNRVKIENKQVIEFINKLGQLTFDLNVFQPEFLEGKEQKKEILRLNKLIKQKDEEIHTIKNKIKGILS